MPGKTSLVTHSVFANEIIASGHVQLPELVITQCLSRKTAVTMAAHYKNNYRYMYFSYDCLKSRLKHKSAFSSFQISCTMLKTLRQFSAETNVDWGRMTTTSNVERIGSRINFAFTIAKH